MISNKHITKLTAVLISLTLCLCILAMGFSDKLALVLGVSGYNLEYESKLFNTSEIIDIDIQVDSEIWQTMLDNAIREEYIECDAVINGTTFYSVGIRTKGNTSLSAVANDPTSDRYSFKLEFDKFVDGQTCFGLDKLVLNNNYADTTNMKEALIYDMYRYLDADASLYNYAKISVNGEYWGVYLALEAVEDSFMLRNFGTERGYLYKPDSMNMSNRGKQGYEFQNDNDHSGSDGNRPDGNRPEEKDSSSAGNTSIKPEFAENGERPFGGKAPDAGLGNGPGGSGSNGANLNYSDDELDSYSAIWDGAVTAGSDSDHQRVVTALKNVNAGTNLEKYLDVDNALKYMAVHSFAVNDDSLSGNMAHNYYLYESGGQLNILPWDYNLSFGGMNGKSALDVINDPIDSPFSSTQFFDALLENEEYKTRYHEYYSKLINEYLYGGKFGEAYQRIRSQIDGLVETDPNAMYTYDEYITGAETLYDVIMLRAESIKGQLNGSIPSTAEAQRADSSSLVDASSIDISLMGEFMSGGSRNKNNVTPESEKPGNTDITQNTPPANGQPPSAEGQHSHGQPFGERNVPPGNSPHVSPPDFGGEKGAPSSGNSPDMPQNDGFSGEEDRGRHGGTASKQPNSKVTEQSSPADGSDAQGR